MYEVEVKVRAEHETVRERLATLDVRFRGTVTQEDTYYDAPHREFADTDEALRIRREKSVEAGAGDGDEGTSEHDGSGTDAGVETTILTYKGPLVDSESKTRREAETAVEDAEELSEILSALGFTPAATVSKERSVYTASGEGTVALDRVAEVGEFVEIEFEADGGDGIDAAREHAYGVLRDLGLDPENGIRTSYLGLLLDGGENADQPGT